MFWVHYKLHVATLLWESVRMKLTFLKWGLGSPLGLSKLQSLIAGGQNTLHWGVLHIIGKLSKCKCQKWACMNHSDICRTSYGEKKGWESNWQFDLRPLKVENWPNPGLHSWNATCHWKALKESYKFSLDLIPIRGLRKELWSLKVLVV